MEEGKELLGVEVEFRTKINNQKTSYTHSTFITKGAFERLEEM